MGGIRLILSSDEMQTERNVVCNHGRWVGLVIPLVNAPAAQANYNANQQWDPVIGTCWTKRDRNSME